MWIKSRNLKKKTKKNITENKQKFILMEGSTKQLQIHTLDMFEGTSKHIKHKLTKLKKNK